MRHAGRVAEFERVRERTERLFSLLAPEAYYERPIPLRHPFVFYEGHLDAFNDTRLQRHLGLSSLHPAFDALFERGIDPADAAAASRHRVAAWPARHQVRAYAARLRDRLCEQLARLEGVERIGELSLDELFGTLLEHELMHQETLMYMLHQLPFALKRAPADRPVLPEDPAAAPGMVAIPAGTAVLGQAAGAFGWDNEFPRQVRAVPAFAIDRLNVTNGDFLAFVEAGGYARPELWSERSRAWKGDRRHPHYWRRDGERWRLRGLFEEEDLPLSHPVYVTHAEATAYARFVGKELPSEAEWHRAAFGDGAGPYPWGAAAPGPEHGNFDFRRWSTVPVGAHPAGASSSGVLDLVGNGWEWTRTPFAPFAGFTPSRVYPAYSADFFDGEHFVIKGASCFTDRRLLRPSMRNWFYWHYPYMYATFRCVSR